MSAVFVEEIIRKVNERPFFHRCNNHQLYFEDELSRGTFCGVCNKTIDEEFFNLRNKSGEINHEHSSN